MTHLKILFAILLLLCLLHMPYGYYQFIRFVAMVAFTIMAYQYSQNEKGEMAITFGALALLFQPFFKIALGRAMWNVVDVVVAIGLVILWWQEQREGEQNN